MVLSKSDMNSMLDIIHSSLSCHTKKEYELLIDATKSLIPMTQIRSLFGDCKDYPEKKMGAFKMITHFPMAWEIRYNEKNYFLSDNIAFTAFRKTGLIYWGDYTVLEGVDDNRNKESIKIMDEASSIGLKHGWLFSAKGRRSSECAVLSLAGDQCDQCERSRKILEHLSPHLCLAIRRVIFSQDKVTTRLTRRECEVLTWTAAGKTAWETSEILSISRRTVEFHMGNILNKLDAVNSQQAIAIALSSGLITY